MEFLSFFLRVAFVGQGFVVGFDSSRNFTVKFDVLSRKVNCRSPLAPLIATPHFRRRPYVGKEMRSKDEASPIRKKSSDGAAVTGSRQAISDARFSPFFGR